MIKLIDLLLEIGDSTAGSFKNISLEDTQYTNDNEPVKSTYSFNSDKNEYIVNIKYMLEPKNSSKDKRYYLYVDFKTKEGRFSDVTKENAPLRIMATVTEIIRKEIERVKSDSKISVKDKVNIIAGVIFSPAKSYKLDSVGRPMEVGKEKRKSLYIAYIKKNIPGSKEITVPSGLKFPSDVTAENLIAFEFPLKRTSFLGKLGAGVKNLFNGNA